MPKEKLKLRIKDWLKKNGKETLGNSLEFIGENTSIPILSGLIDKIGESLQQDKDITPEQIEEFKRLAELDKIEMLELTKRWQSDNSQDLKLPKLIRPSILAYSWILLTLLVVLDAFGIVIDSVFVKTFEILALTVNGAYFGARTIEKYHNNKYK